MRSTLLAAGLVSFGLAEAGAEPFAFIALGDMPYGKPEAVYAPFEALIAEVNARTPDLVVHIGDTKSGGTPCSNRMLDDQRAYMMQFAAPTIYTPGDNEWTDCHRKKAGKFDPLERLSYIRQTYFAEPGTSLGAVPVAVEHQGDTGYPENTRLTHKSVTFIAAHVVGSNNNFETRDITAVQEFMARDAASTAWLQESFAAAEGSDAVVVAIHADMFEFDFNMFGNERWLRHSGFNRFGPALKEAAAAFGKPVLLVYGDSHKFRFFQPFPKTAANITALEVYGAKDMHAVEVTVDPGADRPFSVGKVVNPAL